MGGTIAAVVGIGELGARTSAQAPGVWTLAAASWIHGVSLQVEDPSSIKSLSRRGFQTQVQTYKQAWVHFAIPTPVVQSGSKLRLRRVRLLWDTDVVYYTCPAQPNGRIWAMHVWDGDNKLAEFGEENFHYIGKCRGQDVQDVRTNDLEIPGTPYVYYGVAISMLIEAPAGINFKSVGGEFYLFTSQGCVSC